MKLIRKSPPAHFAKTFELSFWQDPNYFKPGHYTKTKVAVSLAAMALVGGGVYWALKDKVGV